MPKTAEAVFKANTNSLPVSLLCLPPQNDQPVIPCEVKLSLRKKFPFSLLFSFKNSIAGMEVMSFP